MRTAAYSLYLGSIAVLLFLSFFELFLGGASADLLGAFSALGLLAGSLMVLVYTAFRPSWAKARELLIAVCVTAGAIRFAPSVGNAGVTLFWATREDRATMFVAELLSYGRIRDMDDGQRFFNELNGELVTSTPDRVDSGNVTTIRPTLPVQAVLARDAIDPQIYETFLVRLRNLKLMRVEVHEVYVRFVHEGFLDGPHGFFWVRPGHRPPLAARLRPLGNGWYYFAMT